MRSSELAEQADPLRTDWDIKVIDATSAALIEVGKDDDIQRLREQIEKGPSEDKLHTACEIAIAWIRFAQDLKEELRSLKAAGYL